MGYLNAQELYGEIADYERRLAYQIAADYPADYDPFAEYKEEEQ